MLKLILASLLIFSKATFAEDQVWAELASGLPSDTRGKQADWNPPCPLPKKSGIIWRSQTYTHPENTWLRVHLVLDNIPISASWKIDIIGMEDQVNESITRKTLQAGGGQNDWWSEKVPGNQVRVELSSAGGDLGAFCPKVDLIKYPIAPVSRFSEFGKFSWEDITTLGIHDSMYKTGQSVARIIVPDRNGNDNSCTGFLVSSDRMFTNSHCFRNVDIDHICGPDKLKVHFNEETGQRVQKVDCELVEVNWPPLDLAVLKLKMPSLSNRRPLMLSRRLPINVDAKKSKDDLAIIQHPALNFSFLKQIVRTECERHGELLAGAFPNSNSNAVYAQPDFGHECDTDGGSSGSPVIDHNNCVVGLHHWGIENAPSPYPYNRAVAMAKILQWIEENHKPIFNQLRIAEASCLPR